MEIDLKIEKPQYAGDDASVEDLVTFSKSYIANFYNTIEGELPSARDFRYAALELGFQIDHLVALSILTKVEKEVVLEMKQQREEEDSLYARTQGEHISARSSIIYPSGLPDLH